jgi:hypothetical protein
MRWSGLLLVLAVGCAHGGAGAPASSAATTGELRSAHYTDNSGISVTTLSASGERPAGGAVLGVHAAVERITLERKPLDPGDPGAEQSTGHPPHEPDAVTSASATAGGGAVAQEWRFEAVATGRVERTLRDRPVSAGALVKASTEPDYRSAYLNLSGAVELFERNTTLSGSLGYGRDWVQPVEAPPGQLDDWPATHDRFTAGFAFGQLLSPRLVLGAGAGLTVQHGQLASPYRRALVRTSLFPEVAPDTRLRATAFAMLSLHLGAGTALHLRQGLYGDSWRVFAVIPEAVLNREIGSRWLLSGRYRLYQQSAARFYEARYHVLEEYLTGDARLGPITEHSGSAEAQVMLWGETAGQRGLGLLVSYDLSALDYHDLATAWIIGHALSVGVAGRLD